MPNRCEKLREKMVIKRDNLVNSCDKENKGEAEDKSRPEIHTLRTRHKDECYRDRMSR